ncbi:pseudouridine synthase [Arcobacter sp. F2176]|uniref:pseudouridine synthase n=1 Tax=Arcobacter sp. F2176 TaxID=2044511 RepID=UPI00100A4C1B|nr:pseudouridine synthase [Arcobacter sp. F2176]RXJ81479.1 pseudouridine synthase [Arcobacter sp. F2176]
MKNQTETKEDNTRLNKFISHNSKYSRREADAIIAEGRVKVNKKTITDLSTKVLDSDIVAIDNKPIKFEKNKMYTVLVYNKPKGELVTKNDPQGRRIIFDTLGAKYKHFLPIGRLDYASEGVLLLTDSVDVANGLMHSDLQRVYKIKVSGPINKQVEDAMLHGLELEDATKGAWKDSKVKSMNFAPFLGYKIDSVKDTFSKLKVAITEGKNRELRRFFAHFGLDVMDLKRVEYGGISLNNLPTGKSRYLTREEYKNLKDYLHSKDND